MMNTTLQISLLMAWMFLLATPAAATVISTPRGMIAEAVTNSSEAYAKDHEGRMPLSWDDLAPYCDAERVRMNFKAPAESLMLMVGKNHPKIGTLPSLALVALSAYPISDDRHRTLGRYIVYQRPDGRFFSRWEGEASLQAALAQVNTQIPEAAVFHEKSLKFSDPGRFVSWVNAAVIAGLAALATGVFMLACRKWQ
ncbi:MAG: hypothetical protein K9N47_19145 [Prosthecobacter sp.]|uniref:hypothetical protein n=1 Tax=Prosthecobacter sp. TaxID=1965333 RepID=UPI0025DC1B24|nr:hypothetical protein [Prosthecobacter sp.]MCF7788247.1 hypothetical protein [Prosthecobacter sp.]